MCKKRYVITATTYDRRGNVLAVRTNDYNRTHPWQKELSIRAGLHEGRTKLHAEVASILAANRTRKKIHSIFIERYDSTGKPKLAHPCKSCIEAILLTGIKLVKFTSEEGIKEVKFSYNKV